MSDSSLFEISAAGMSVESLRVKVATLNMANAHAAAAPGKPGYAPLRVVVTASHPTFDAVMASMPTALVEPAKAEPRKVLEPGHPFADAKGFVSYPAVDSATEMMTLLSATRAYEANVAALNTARTLALKALDIGSGQ